jgi:hypothetical protein
MDGSCSTRVQQRGKVDGLLLLFDSSCKLHDDAAVPVTAVVDETPHTCCPGFSRPWLQGAVD